MGLMEHAKKELELAGLFAKDSDYGGMLGDAVLELIEKFAEQGHSGASAGMVSDLFGRLSHYQQLTPLTLKDDEWVDHGDGHFQNNRISSVFKEGKDGRAFYNDAYYKKTQTGSTWNGSLSLGDGTRIAKCYIKDVKNMPKICIDIIDWEVNKKTGVIEVGSGWWEHKIKDIKQLDELKKYYDIEIVPDC